MAATAEPYVGRSIPRVEDPRLLTGRGCYAADVDLEGQLHAHVVRSDVAHGRIVSIDTEAASGVDGVVRVITAADLPDVRVPIRLFPTENAIQALQAPLARDRVRFVGDPIAVVVATHPYVAEDAAELVHVEVEPLPALLEAPRAGDPDAELLFPELGTNVIDTLTVGKGDDLDALFARAPVVVSERFSVQRHGAVPMETRTVTARHDPERRRLTVWGAAKVKHFNRKILADLLDLPEDDIRCIEGDVGGGFGARGEFYPEDYLIPWLAMELGRPVKWVEDRREDLLALNHSREQDWEIDYAAEADGRLIAFRAKALFNQGAYVRTHGSTTLPALMLNHIPGPYRWEGYRAEATTVLTNKTPAGTYRGPGQYEPTYVRERMVDLVAREVGIDPAEMRRRNLVAPAEMPYDSGLLDIDTGHRVLYDDGDFPMVYESLLERAGYDELRRQVEERRGQGGSERLGLSATAFIEMGNPGVFEQARVVAEDDGSFTAHVGIASVGQGVETVLSQIMADLLQVPIERVRISYRDTEIVPEGQGAFSSRATVWGGYAISGAVHELQRRAREAAAERLEIAEADLEVLPGAMVQPRGAPGRAISFAELGIEGFYRYQPSTGSHTLMGANVCLLGVDVDSGRIRLLRYLIAYEVGRAINPLTLDGQIIGAAAQGIGGALLEEFAYGPDGQPLSTSFLDYAMPTAAEIPDIDVLVFELGKTTDDDPVSGAKGAGEGGIIATAATISNAVADAVAPSTRGLNALPLRPGDVQALARSDGAPGGERS